jgi:hypothetical protein
MQAYAMSRLACGEDVPITRKMKRLAENVPRTVGELLAHFS